MNFSVTATFTDHAERTKAIGLWSAVSGLGVAIGPVAGGWLLAHFNWDSIFLVNLPIVAVALVAGYWLVPASRSAGVSGSGRLDLAGAALSVAAFTGLTYTIIEAPSNGWLSVRTLGLGAVSIALLALFVAFQARAEHPMLPLRLFRTRASPGPACPSPCCSSPCLVVAFRAFRPARVTAPAKGTVEVPAEVPAKARVLEAARS